MHTERQVQILDLSIKLIDNNGIQGFTIKNLSKEIGISEPAIYRHFESKTAILVAILDNFKEMVLKMYSQFTDSDSSAIGNIQSVFTKMLDVFSAQPSIISVIFSEEIFKNEVVLKNKIVEIQNFHQTKIEDIIEKGQEANNIRNDIDKTTLALIYMGAFRLLVKRWDLNGSNFDLKSEGEKLISSFKLFI